MLRFVLNNKVVLKIQVIMATLPYVMKKKKKKHMKYQWYHSSPKKMACMCYKLSEFQSYLLGPLLGRTTCRHAVPGANTSENKKNANYGKGFRLRCDAYECILIKTNWNNIYSIPATIVERTSFPRETEKRLKKSTLDS